MVSRLKLSFLAFICVLAACAGNGPSTGPAPEQAKIASIEQLGSDEDGSRVQIQGWIEINPETFRLWSSEKKRESLEDAHCIGVVIPRGADRELLDRSDVIVIGHFIEDVTGDYVVLGGCRNRRFVFADEIRLLAKDQE
jgi:hypothetical protein